MHSLTDEEILEITTELELGLLVYFHKKTRKIVSLPDFEVHYFTVEDEDLWPGKKEVEGNEEEYIKFEPWDSDDSYRVRKDFACQLDDEDLKKRLLKALNNRKPFRNFGYEIDDSGPYRQQWFDYSRMRYLKNVRRQLNFANMEEFGVEYDEEE